MGPAADVAASLVQNSPPAGASTPVHKMFRVIEAGLGYQYVSVWNLVLMVINQFFEVRSAILFFSDPAVVSNGLPFSELVALV